MTNLQEIRISLEKSLDKHGKKIGFIHPINSQRYDIFVKEGLIHIYSKFYTQKKVMTWDGLLHLWLENPDYNE